MNTELLMDLLMRIEVQLGVAGFIIVLIFVLSFRFLRLKGLKHRMQVLEERYSAIKSVPLPFKLNKAVALARVNQVVMESVNDFKNRFDDIQDNFKSIVHILAETEDALVISRPKVARQNLNDLTLMLNQIEKQVQTLSDELDQILEEENQQRTQITDLKQQLRKCKADIQARAVQLTHNRAQLDLMIADVEKLFTSFEEWMYASEFAKAKEVMVEIEVSLISIKECIEVLPDLNALALGIIPKQIEEISELLKRLNTQNIYTKHLEVLKNLELISETTQKAAIDLSRCVLTGIHENLHQNQNRLQQLMSLLEKEEQAHQDISDLLKQLDEQSFALKSLHQELQEHHQKDAGRFGWDQLQSLLEDKQASLKQLDLTIKRLTKGYLDRSLPASAILMNIREAQQLLINTRNDLKHATERLSTARSDEDRARKQLLKLNLIMNEIQVKIRKFRLPVIASTYEADLRKSYQYISSIKKLLKDESVDIQLLNATVNDAIDFIYKLYNNVNNLVGTVEMIEHTIVYGNKYRSFMPDLDAELTRAELLFKNGDYTQAIKVAIAAVEAIQPKNFEGLIKENSRSVAI
jgi:septation ring formation regulator